MIHFTSDWHLRHQGIIEICNRPFKSLVDMERTLIRNWNAVVGDEDTVYMVGDFSLESARQRQWYEDTLAKMRGRKILVVGNHDNNKIYFYAGDRGVGFFKVAYPYELVEEFVVIHDPVAAIVYPEKNFITGHVHQQWHTMHNCYNCGVDVNDYVPVSIETIRSHFRNQVKK